MVLDKAFYDKTMKRLAKRLARLARGAKSDEKAGEELLVELRRVVDPVIIELEKLRKR